MTVNITDDSVGTHHMSGSVLSNTLTQQICTSLLTAMSRPVTALHALSRYSNE